MKSQSRLMALVLAFLLCLSSGAFAATDIYELADTFAAYATAVANLEAATTMEIYAGSTLSNHLTQSSSDSKGKTQMDEEENAVKLYFEGTALDNDAWVNFSSSIDEEEALASEEYPYVVVTFKTNISSDMRLYYWSNGSSSSESYAASNNYTADTENYQYKVFKAKWPGETIKGFRFDFTTTASVDYYMFVDSIILCGDENVAKQMGEQRVAARNKDGEVPSIISITGRSILNYFSGYHNTNYGYDSAEKAVKLTVDNRCKTADNYGHHNVNSYTCTENNKPYRTGKALDVFVGFDVRSLNLQTEDYPFVVVTYRVPTENISNCRTEGYLSSDGKGENGLTGTVYQLPMEMFPTTGPENGAISGVSESFKLEESEFYTSSYIYLPKAYEDVENVKWVGQLKEVRLDYFADHYSPVGDVMYIASLNFCSTEEQVKEITAKQPGQSQRYGVGIGFNPNCPADEVSNMPAGKHEFMTAVASHEFTWTEEPSRLYYNFMGWGEKADDNNPKKINSYTVTAEESNAFTQKMLYAIWSPVTYTITYDANNGTVSPTTQTYTVENNVDLLSPVRAGYAFTGWKVTETDDSTWPAEHVITNLSLAAGLHGNVTLTAQWEAQFTDLKIVKTGAEEIDEKQSFIFHVTGVSSSADAANVDMKVVINGDDPVTIKGLPVGEYKVEEVSSWSWRYTPGDGVVTLLSSGETVSGESGAKILLNNPDETKVVTFSNVRSNAKWLDGSDYETNSFGSIN